MQVKKYRCGMCPSCYQRGACPVDGEIGRSCPNYLPPEPTRSEWPDIYTEYLKAAERALREELPGTQIHALKNARITRAAMLQIHGFTKEEVTEIENQTGISREMIREIQG